MPVFARRQVLSSLRDLADEKLQEDRWIHGVARGPMSPTEAICQLFDDTASTDYLEKERQPVLSVRVAAMLRGLRALLERVDVDLPPRILLNHPSWRAVQHFAREIADELEPLLPRRKE